MPQNLQEKIYNPPTHTHTQLQPSQLQPSWMVHSDNLGFNQITSQEAKQGPKLCSYSPLLGEESTSPTKWTVLEGETNKCKALCTLAFCTIRSELWQYWNNWTFSMTAKYPPDCWLHLITLALCVCVCVEGGGLGDEEGCSRWILKNTF